MKFVAKPFMDLNLDHLYEVEDDLYLYQMAHYKENDWGDLMADPIVEIEVNHKDKSACAVGYKNDFVNQEIEGNADLMGYVFSWLKNVKSKGYFLAESEML
jgi:hypothetical protein